VATMLERARQIQDQLVAWRRELHMAPELSFRETRTAARIAEEMERLGCRVRTGVGRTGVVADLGRGQPLVGIRADIDAIPIQEANDVPYASQCLGIMHACGHDAHTAIAMGAATLLAGIGLPGTVRFLFQPAEEQADEEGLSGALRMAQDGAFEGVDAVLGLHVDASSPVGKVKVSAGPVTAGSDSFVAAIFGRGGHPGMPEKAIDPVYIAGHVILALHAIVSQRVTAGSAATLVVTALRAGEVANVIPQRVEMTGSIRYKDPAVRALLHAQVNSALQISQALGGSYELAFKTGLQPTVNDARIAARVQEVAADLLGPECFKTPDYGMAGEDFSAIASLVPSTWFALGCGIEGDERFHHHPRFDVDERCLPIGAAILAETALRLLGQAW
jgi:amidohydrolase